MNRPKNEILHKSMREAPLVQRQPKAIFLSLLHVLTSFAVLGQRPPEYCSILGCDMAKSSGAPHACLLCHWIKDYAG